jgi:NhaP-type Na+/H+ or K+/H+ antiporter
VAFTLDNIEIMLFCSLMCSSDVIAAVSILKYETQPKIFSLVFGEGIMNDAVSIILFDTVASFSGGDNKFSAATPFEIAGNFLFLFLMSLLIGSFFALLTSYILKRARFMTQSAVTETAVIFSFSYLAYAISQALAFSGIITLLTCGIMQAHYTWFNLSP